LEKAGLTPLIEAGISTHTAGNRLDQLWANLEVASFQLIKVDEICSDHKMIQADLLFKIGGQLKKVSSDEIFYTP
jgi:hypothetical protein